MSCTTVESARVSRRCRSRIEVCMWKSGSRAAVWGYRLELGRIEEVRACSLTVVREACCGAPHFAVFSSAHDEKGQRPGAEPVLPGSGASRRRLPPALRRRRRPGCAEAMRPRVHCPVVDTPAHTCVLYVCGTPTGPQPVGVLAFLSRKRLKPNALRASLRLCLAPGALLPGRDRARALASGRAGPRPDGGA